MLALAGDRFAFLATLPAYRGEEPALEGAFAGIIFKALHGLGHAAEDFLNDVWGGIAVGASAGRESMNEWAIDFHELGPRLLVLAVTNAQEQGWASHVCLVSRTRGGASLGTYRMESGSAMDI